MKGKKIKERIIPILMIVILIYSLWFKGIIVLWMNGMAYIANNTEEFTDKKGYIISNEYTISINLNDLKSNIGKELYNDGKCRIYVSWIDNTGNSNAGGYRIGFRSSGQYSLNGAVLVSGARHETMSSNSFRAYMVAEMTAKYKDKIYNSSEFGISGLNYKDGDDFSFYIFPHKAYDSKEVSTNEKGFVDLFIKYLYKNIWTKN